MKKIIIMLITFILLLTGCASNDLNDYKEAIKKTEAIEKGKMNLSIKTDINFNTEGLTETQIRDLSYFDQMEFDTAVQYDESAEIEKTIVKGYFNLGGMGLDMDFYFNGDEAYMKMPIIEKYVSLKDMEQKETENPFKDLETDKILKPITDKWNELLKQENVFKGKKTYLLTDVGQIKTTTYTIEASEEQLKVLGDEMVRVIKDEGVIEALIEQGLDNQNIEGVEDIDPQEIITHIEDYINRLVLENFKGTAYVDFDGRLIKETYALQLGWKDAKKGEPTDIQITMTQDYESLGEEQVFEFPTVKEDEWIEMDQFNQETFLPDGLFN